MFLDRPSLGRLARFAGPFARVSCAVRSGAARVAAAARVRGLASAVVALALFGLTGCSSTDTGVDDSGTSATSGAGPGGPRSRTETGTAGAPQGPGTVQEQRSRLLVEVFLENADRLRAQGTVQGLEAARIELLKARELMPTDARVNERLQLVNAELDLPAATAETFGEEMEKQGEVNAQRRRSEVRSLLDSGNVALDQQNYRKAIEDGERALLTIQTSRFIEWGDLQGQAQNLVDRANEARDQAEAAEREAAQADLRRERQRIELERAARLRAEVNDLLDKAALAFQLRRFDDAKELAYRAMRIDPANRVAAELHNASIKAGRERKTDDYYRAMAVRMRRMQEEAEDLRIPQVDILHVDPEVWERANDRVPPAVSRATVDPEDAELRRLVETEMVPPLSFDEESGRYDEVKTRLTAITNIPIIITPEARDVIDGEDLKLVMDVTAPISVANFLKQMVARSAELAWIVQDGVVQITTKALAGGQNYLDQKDVRDLVFGRTVFLPPTIRDIPSGEDLGEAPRTGGEGEDKTYFVEIDILVQNIKEATDPEYWDGDSGAQIDTAEAGYLLVTANPEMQKRVDGVLSDLRRFATTVVTIESKFLTVSRNFLQEVGVDFRGLGGSGSKGTVAQLDDITNGLDDNASRGLDNAGTADPAGNPSSGAFYNDGNDGDIRGRTENYFSDSLGSALSPNGGLTAAVAFLDDLQIQAILTAVEKRQDVQELNGQNLTVLNNERGHVAIINQTAYVRDFDVEVAQAAFIADPRIDVIQDGIVLDVKPTVSHDRRHITLDMQPTVAELIRPIPTFSTSLAGATQPVTVQLPQLIVRSFATTVTVPDGSSVLIGGLREVLNRERRAEIPILGRIPLLSFFFKQEGVVDENSSLMVLVRASITDVKDLMDGR